MHVGKKTKPTTPSPPPPTKPPEKMNKVKNQGTCGPTVVIVPFSGKYGRHQQQHTTLNEAKHLGKGFRSKGKKQMIRGLVLQYIVSG